MPGPRDSRRAAAFGVALLLASAAFHPAFAAEGCLGGVREHGDFAGLSAGAEITLGDGRVLRLAGLETGPDLVAALRAGLSDGAPLLFDSMGAAPDRWGRLVVQLFLPGEAGREPDWVQQALLERGLARAKPESLPAPCWARLLALEDQARAARAGVWASESAVLRASDRGALLAAAGKRVVVEGQVLGLGQGRSLLFLNFGANRFEDFTVTVLKRRAVMMRKAGVGLEQLTGKRVRLRGMMAAGRQPRMEIYAADEIELLE